MKFNVLTVPDALKIFNQYFGVEINDLEELEHCLNHAGATWSQVDRWDAHLPAEQVLEQLKLEKLPGRVFVTTDETYDSLHEWYFEFPGRECLREKLGVFEVHGEDVDEFILTYVDNLPSCFFNCGDNMIIWLDVGRVAFISHEGWFYVFNLETAVHSTQ